MIYSKLGPKIWQLRLGPLWVTKTGKDVTVWWSHWLKVFSGEVMVVRKET